MRKLLVSFALVGLLAAGTLALAPADRAGAAVTAPYVLTASGVPHLGLKTWRADHDSDRHLRGGRDPHHLKGGIYTYSPHVAGKRPLVMVIGASFAAGVGAGGPAKAWPEDLARLMGWRLLVAADPGAGYLNPGSGHFGPFSRMLGRLALAKRRPRLVIVQGGHDDLGWWPAVEKQRVEELITTIETEAPGAHIAVLSVFSARERPRRRLWEIDRAVVQGATAADPGVVVFNPIASGWDYPRLPGHLHPNSKGYDWIARRLDHLLRKNGFLSPVPPAAASIGRPPGSPTDAA